MLNFHVLLLIFCGVFFSNYCVTQETSNFTSKDFVNVSEIITSSTLLFQQEDEPVLNPSDPLEGSPLVLQIKDGRIKGRELRTIDRNVKYYAFQGIPYAEPPVDHLRFNDPVPAQSWDFILRTQDDERRCIQSAKNDVIGSEDCLYINVFTTSEIFEGNQNLTEENLKPVMVWIYGGYFLKGSSKIYKFGPDYFLENDVIIVTFNYRLGVFGFLSTEDMAATGNWALKDQILALKWVQDNIRYFGGNPKNVTLFGQSAGAACVSYLLQSPLTEGLFHRAILQSGTSLQPWSLARKPRDVAFGIGKLLDIKTQNSTKLVEYLRKVEPRTLHYMALTSDLGATLVRGPLDGLVFAPSIEPRHPQAVVTEKSHNLVKYGNFNRMPVMLGFTSQESIPFVDVIDYIRPYLLTFDLFSTRLVPKDMNIENNLEKIMVAFQIRHKYFELRPILLSNKKLVQFVTDDQFVRAIHEYAFQISKWTYPTYLYRFSYEGETGVKGDKREIQGVEHGEELYYLWAQYDSLQQPPVVDLKMREKLLKLWTNFAKTSNPTPNVDPLLSNLTWPSTSIQQMVYMDLGRSFKVSSDFDEYNIDFWTELYSKHGKPPYDTY